MAKQTFRVLLVDDEPMLVETMRAILDSDFHVKVSYSAQDALARLASEPFDVVCADWQMPGINGVEFFRLLSRRAHLRTCSCILVTAHAEALFGQVAWRERKMFGFLRKPFRPSDLVERVTHFAHLAVMKRSSRDLSAAVRRVALSGAG
ncbi:MAG TPA: response regulator [Polyangiaceae bacterium]|nr:response regulator [Polyangiaceae bacterium]